MAKPLTIAALVLALVAAVFWQGNPINAAAERQAGRVALAAGGVYVSLRTLNAVLSTAQEVEVQAAVGVGGSAQPLKALEPIDDTIERIAGVVFWIMLAAVALSVSTGPLAALGAGLAAVGLTLHLYAPGRMSAQAVRWGGMFALGLPLVVALAAPIGGALTTGVREDSLAQITAITSTLPSPEEAIPAPTDAAAEGFFAGMAEGMRSLTGAAGAMIERIGDYTAIAAAIFDNADVLIGAYLNLLAVMLFQVLILPLAACAMLVMAIRRS
ncbi:MAG: hypothetical protein AAF092_07580 [Pseudomonadota bacterium]